MTFRFPIAIAHYCQKRGFGFAMEKAKEFAIGKTRKLSSQEINDAARAYVDSCMKARIQQFAELADNR